MLLGDSVAIDSIKRTYRVIVASAAKQSRDRRVDCPTYYGYIDGYNTWESLMTEYSVADAKNRLPTLIDKALQGEEVVIARRGKPVVELKPASSRPEPPIGTDEWLFARTRSRPSVGISSVELLNLIYESEED